MAKHGKKRVSRSGREQPQAFEHRSECALAALNNAIAGSHMLVKFLLAEQGARWPDYECLVTASGDLRRAQRWLKHAAAEQRARQRRSG